MIPKSFKLVNRTYKVEKMGRELAQDLGRYGDTSRGKAVIRLDETEPKENVEHTFYHELAHALLWASTKPKLSKKEDFVDSLGAALHQFMQTQKGEWG